MPRLLSELSDKEIQNFIKSYEREDKTEGGIFSLAELRVEKLRRFPSVRAPGEIFRFIVEEASTSPSGTVTYGKVWEFLKPQTPWQGNHSIRIVGSSLGAVIAYCVRHGLPLVSTLVVQSGSGKLSDRAVINIYNEANLYGRGVGLNADEFVQSEAAKARQINLAGLPEL
jgi:hypothetical protein